MNITDYCDIINRNIKITYYNNQNCRWSASFEDSEVKEKSTLCGVFGNGETPQIAVEDYLKKIRGKTIVFGAFTDKRTEFVVPLSLSYVEAT